VGKVYKTHLIVLNGQGIDVILGMSWMKERRALLDIASSSMRLRSPEHGVVVIQLPSPSMTNPLVHHTTAQNLEDILVAYEFPNVFSDDFPGVPSDRDV
jgi:hypothetical protein